MTLKSYCMLSVFMYTIYHLQWSAVAIISQGSPKKKPQFIILAECFSQLFCIFQFPQGNFLVQFYYKRYFLKTVNQHIANLNFSQLSSQGCSSLPSPSGLQVRFVADPIPERWQSGRSSVQLMESCGNKPANTENTTEVHRRFHYFKCSSADKQYIKM